MDFEEMVKQRYATKLFDKNRKVDEKLVDRLIEIIRLSPSSYNLQPWKIKIVKDDETKKKLFKASYNQPQVETCSHLLVFCVDTDVTSRLKKIEQAMREKCVEDEKIRNYNSMITQVVSSMSEKDLVNWLQKQLYIALANALNGAKYLGFDSCPMEGFDPKEYSKILNLPKNLIPTLLCPIGYAADKPREKVRLKKEDIVF
jgi:nitroreductase/dihydropteridine reductase